MDKGLINVDSKSIYYEFINAELLNRDAMHYVSIPLLIFLHHGVGV